MNFKILPIDGYLGYFAGEDGNIYSYRKHGIIDLNILPCRLKASLDGKGKYLHVHIKNILVKFVSKNIAPLICKAFNGTPKDGYEVSHFDGNKLNNKPSNLIWETRSENHQRKKLHGTDDRGYRNKMSLITKDQLLKIRNLLLEGKLTHKEIGNLFGVNRVFIKKINTGYRYKDQ